MKSSKIIQKSYLLLMAGLIFSCQNTKVSPPEPFGVLPSDRQVSWHDTEFYGFIHFTINTFTGKEWGFGDESPKIFNPSEFNAEQIVQTCKNAGMKGLILTAKHHDGFCLWPTKTTNHNISKSPYKNGEGDIVKEISEACKKYGLKMGVYLSPWDRNNATYGTPEYIKFYRTQLTELLTNYGDIFEIWFDGANGGDGYYGGANEKRKIDRTTYYDWDNTFKIVRELQPNAVIFSDIGPGTRWVGNESGYSGDPCWHRYTPHGVDGGAPSIGQTMSKEGISGHREGDYWIPAEADVSIRPGWFYHKDQDKKVKSPEKLLQIYYESIGHGTTLNLNLPPDKRGLIHENDVKNLEAFRAILNTTFNTDLTEKATFSTTNTRGNSNIYAVDNVRDDNQDSYWATDDGIHTGELVVEFEKVTSFNIVNIREFIPLGQKIWGWTLDIWSGDKWVEFAKGESIGHRRLWRGSLQTSEKLRFRIIEAAGSPAITQFSVHLEPIKVKEAVIPN